MSRDIHQKSYPKAVLVFDPCSVNEQAQKYRSFKRINKKNMDKTIKKIKKIVSARGSGKTVIVDSIDTRLITERPATEIKSNKQRVEILFGKKVAAHTYSKKNAHLLVKPITIAEHLRKFMQYDSNRLCLTGEFTVEDFKLLTEALNGSLDNFIVFDNAGGRPFVIFCRTVKQISVLVKEMKSYVYMYKINGKEIIVKNLPTEY